MTSHTRFYRWMTLTGYFGLLGLLMAWNTVIAPSQYFPVAMVLVILVVPLLFPLRGLLHGKIYTHRWAPFLALFYFAFGIVDAVSNPDVRTLAIGEIILSLMFFSGALLYVRSQ